MFDSVICNPPYAGKSQLHQQFFIRSYELLKEGGTQVFVQPATPVQNKKEWAWREHERLMIENMKTNKVNIKICGWDIFSGNAAGSTDLMISVTTKEPSNCGIELLEYISGEVYKNISIEGLNRAEMNPFIFVSLRQKFLSYKSDLQSIVFYTPYAKDIPQGMSGAYIQSIRGHNQTADFFTLVSNDISKHTEYSSEFGGGQCVQIPSEQFDSFYSYAKSYVARTGLLLSKFNSNNHMGELKTVPLPDFSVNRTPQEWDEFMRKELDITDEEWVEIQRVLPDYHSLNKIQNN